MGRDEEAGFAQLRVGAGTLRILSDEPMGRRLRVQLLAHDLILALEEPTGSGVRNALAATVVTIAADDRHADLAHPDIGGPRVIARVTQAATRQLGLRYGLPVSVLLKPVSIRGQRHS